MTHTLDHRRDDIDDHGDPFEQKCLRASFVVSSLGIVASIVGWWVIRFYNSQAVDEGRRMKDLMSIDWSDSVLPLLLFVMFALGAAAFVLAMLGARAVMAAPWKAVMAGAMATTLAMVPVVVLANTWVTAGLVRNFGGD